MNLKTISLNKLTFFLVLVLFSICASAQMSNMISRDTEKKSVFSLAASYGQIIQRDAWFYGFSAEYSHRLNELPIGMAGSLMWDQETDREKNKIVDSFTFAITGSYLISDRFSIGTGLGKGFVDNDNAKKSYKFADGDWSTAIFTGYQIPLKKMSFLGFSLSYEYNISAKEASLSLDLSYGFNF